MSLEIKPLSKGSANDKPFDCPSILPKTAFCWILVGCRGSGKTVLTQNIISKFYKKCFDYTIICSPTINLNDDYEFLKEDNKSVFKFEDPSEFKDIIKEVISSQTDIIKNKRSKCPNTLLILDDCLDSKVLNFKGCTDLLATRGRHLKISVIIISQRLSGISRTIRLNSDVISLFPCINYSEVEQFLEQFVSKTRRKEVLGRVEDVFSIPYNFISIIMKLPIKDRLKVKFGENLLSN